jgi:three-Cys-motif partner protein
MLEAMKVASDVAQAKRSKPFNLDVDYFFVERDGNAIKYLKDLINDSEYRPLSETKIHLVQGDFVSHVTNIIDHIKGRGKAGRSIFVLDQFGYIDAPLPTIRQILQSLPNAEVILTFAVDSLVDYLSTNEQSQGILSKLGLSLSQDLIATAKTSPDWRRIIQFALHKEIPLQTGAAHYTPFFIRSTGAHRDF